MTVTMATWNVPALLPKLSAVMSLAISLGVDILACQEAGINPASRASFRKACAAYGYQAVYGNVAADEDIQSVLISRVPMRSTLLGSSWPMRLAAGIVDFEGAKVIVASVYGHAGSETDRNQFFGQIFESISAYGFSWVALGDWNALTTDPVLLDATAAGLACALDDSFPVLPAATRSGSDASRRIDFGIASRCCVPSHRFQTDDTVYSDHHLVSYDFDFVQLQGFFAPRRRICGNTNVKDDCFLSRWDQLGFDKALASSQVDAAWKLLSDTAEELLCSAPQQQTTHRSASWRPSKRVRGHKAAAMQEPVRLVRLRRLHRRLLHLERFPEDMWLRRRSLHGLQCMAQHFCILKGANAKNVTCYANTVSEIIATFEDDLRFQRIHRWRERMQLDEQQRRAWVLKHADAKTREEKIRPASLGQKTRAVHPMNVLSEQAKLWTDVWKAPNRDPSLAHAFNDILHQVTVEGSERFAGACLSIEVDELFEATKAMKDRAAGPDDWHASKLILLPRAWWVQYTRLWNYVLKSSLIPSRWVEAKIVCIPKDNSDDFRPLAIASVAWRAGARVLVAKVTDWAHTWSNHQVHGGIPEHGVLDCHVRIVHSVASHAEDGVYVQQDLHRFFDSIPIDTITAVLRRLQAPNMLIDLVRAFYLSCKRIFVMSGFHTETWSAAERGLLQGCPLSPLLSSALMFCWAQYVTASGEPVEISVYADDRLFWCWNRDRPGALVEAKRRSDAFDNAAGLTCRASKCHVVAKSPELRAHFQTDAFGYNCSSCLSVLGVAYDLVGRELPKLAKPKTGRLKHVIGAIANASFKWPERRRLMKSLVLPALRWASGIASLDDAALSTLAEDARVAFSHKLAKDMPRCLLFEFLGWDAEPMFATARAHLHAASRLASTSRQWHDLAPLDFATARWPALLPQTVATLSQLHWSFSADGTVISRTDVDGCRRSFIVGIDNTAILDDWLREVFRKRALATCNRIKKSMHRSDAHNVGLATGLDLPRPEPGVALFKGHRALFEHSSGDREIRHACYATGLSHWHFNPTLRCGPEDPRSACLCGGKLPSRPHLVWCCPCTASHRTHLQMPCDRAQERLFTQVLPEYPAPVQDDPQVARRNLRQALCDVFDQPSESVFVATDGSADVGVSAWSAFVPQANVCVACGLQGEDQTPFRAEVTAIEEVLQAIQDVAAHVAAPCKKIVVVCDCKSALEICDGRRGSTPLLSVRIGHVIRSLRAIAAALDFVWVPSHGKQVAGWKPQAPISESSLREWNQKADESAHARVRMLSRGSRRAAWHLQAEQAYQWEIRTLRAVASIATAVRPQLTVS